MTAPNGLGQFVIGVSPIGTLPPFDLTTTLLAQFANSPVLLQLIQNFSGYIDPTANLDAFFDTIFNVDTAVGAGLDVWGRIVNVSRVVAIPSGAANFGFSGPAGTSGDSFNVAPMYQGAPITSNYALSDDAYRVLILAKALFNICDGSTPAINQILRNLFTGRGNCYVIDNLDMTMVYYFNFALTSVEKAIVAQSGALPRPAGVSTTTQTQG